MSYGKKDDDADSGLIKVDRTQVFQEGELPQKPGQIDSNEAGWAATLTEHTRSTVVQQLADSASKMSNPPDQDCPPAVYRREIPHQ